MAAVSEAAPIVIRQAREADIGALMRLAGELGYPADEAGMRQRFASVAADENQQVFVAEESSGAVVGWVHVNFGRWLVVDPRGEVMGLIVSDARRGRGIGRRLRALFQGDRVGIIDGRRDADQNDRRGKREQGGDAAAIMRAD